MGALVLDAAHHSGPSCPVGVVASADGIDRNNRVAIAQAALVKALDPASDPTVLRDFLQLAILYGLCPTAEEIICVQR